MAADDSLLCVSVFAIIVLIVGLPLPIANMAIGIADQDDPCQTMDSVGMSLASWLTGSGVVGLLLVLSLVTFILMFAWQPTTSMISMTVLIILNSVFQFIYTIIGAVILFRSNMKCLDDGADIGVMALITLILYWISIICGCCRARVSTNTEN